jgi:hypothetical protein
MPAEAGIQWRKTLKKQWIPDQVRKDKNTNMRSFANCDTVCFVGMTVFIL